MNNDEKNKTGKIKSTPVHFEKVSRQREINKTLMWVGSVIILVFSAIAFVFVPSVAGGFGDSGVPVYGYWERTPISQTPSSYFTRVLMQQSSQSSTGITQYRDVFDSSVVHFAFNSAVKKSGYVVPTRKIQREMIPQFYDENKVYSARLYNDTSQSVKIEMENNITDYLITLRYNDDLFGSSREVLDGYRLYGIKKSSAEDAFFKKMADRERSFELAAFDLSQFPQSEVIRFGNENSDLFVKYDLSLITVSTEDTAKKLLARINNEEITFEDALSEDTAIKYYSGDDGKLTSAYQYDIKRMVTSDDAFAAVTSLENGTLSGVIQTLNGYSIFRCDGDSVRSTFTEESTDQSVIDLVKNYMTINERGRIEDYYINAAKDFSIAAARDGFEAACEASNITKLDVPSFSLNYKNNPLVGYSSLSEVAPLSAGQAQSNENFLKTAFSLQPNEISSPLVLGNNVIVLKLKEETTKAERDKAAADKAAAEALVNQDVAAENGDDANEINTVANASGEGEIVFAGEDGEGGYSLTMNQWYLSDYDQQAVKSMVLKDKRLKDNFTSVYYKYHTPRN